MRAKAGKYLSHLTAAGIGVAIATGVASWRNTTTQHGGEDAAGTHRHNPAGSPTLAAEREDRPGRLLPGGTIGGFSNEEMKALTSRDFRLAWDAIARRKVSVKERLQLQQDVLRAWAMKDLKGALRAAYNSQWDGSTDEGGISELVDAFSPAFRAQPQDAWELLDSPEFRLARKLFQEDWLNCAMEQHTDVVLRILPEMDAEFSIKAVGKLAEAARSPEARASLMEALAALPEGADIEPLVSQALLYQPPQESPESLRNKLLAADTERARTMAMLEYVSRLGVPGQVLEEGFLSLPESMREDAVRAYTSHRVTSQGPQLVDFMIHSGYWEMLAMPEVTDHVRQAGNRSMDGLKLAQWAGTLPDRPETVEIFQAAIEPIMDRNLVGARNWIDSMPTGTLKDRALAEYAKGNVSHGDPSLYPAALAEIKNPSIRTEVMEWKAQFERGE